MSDGHQARWPKGTPVGPSGKGPGGGRFREDVGGDWAAQLAGRLAPTVGRAITSIEARQHIEAQELASARAADAQFGDHYPAGYHEASARRIAERQAPAGSRAIVVGDHLVVAPSGHYAPGPELGEFTPASKPVDSEVLHQAAEELAALQAANPLPGGLRVHFTGEDSPVGRASGGDGSIHMHGAWTAGQPMDSGTGFVSFFMPVARDQDMTEVRYHVAHEYGHALAATLGHGGLQGIHQEQREHLSPYGKHDYREGYAEAFAEFWLSGGRTTNPAALAYAERYGWHAPEGAEPAEDGYRMEHQPPNPRQHEGVMRLDDLEADMPDVYEHPEYYGHTGEAYYREAVRAMRAVRGKPDAMITIYRGAPPGVTQINSGDWVTTSRTYARQHGFDAEDESKDWPVISMQVPVRDVYWGGNDFIEFGYWPGVS